ncbi:MAG: MarC family protein [Planctomycetota bacterium]
MSALSAAVLLVMVMGPLDNIPVFEAILKDFAVRKRNWIVLREHLIALAVLAVFLFCGRFILDIFQIEGYALSVAGGIILFLIALRMIFAEPGGVFGLVPGGEPFIVPLAVPFIAGPSAMTTVLLLATREPARWPAWLLALMCAWLVSLVILFSATTLSRLLGERTLVAIQRLAGLLLTAVAVQMFLAGMREFMQQK